MPPITLDLLKTINSTLLNHRWTEEDLSGLLTSSSGPISSFETLQQSLAAILRQDLAETPPAAPTPRKP